MSYWGKIFGGGLGFLIGGPAGAIIGAGIGHAADSEFEREQQPPSHDAGPVPRFTIPCPACNSHWEVSAGDWTCSNASCRQVFHVQSCPACGSLWSFLDELVACSCGVTFDLHGREVDSAAIKEEEQAYLLFAAPALLGILIAQADGRVDEVELQAIRDAYADLGEANREHIDEVIAEASSQGGSGDVVGRVREIATALAAALEDTDKAFLLRILYSIAYANRRFDPREEAVIAEFVRAFGVDESVSSALRACFVTGVLSGGNDARLNREGAYRVLGLQPGASENEVKNAYRENAKKYHPDRHSHLGDDFAEVAAKRFKAIREAYEVLVGQADRTEKGLVALCPGCEGVGGALITLDSAKPCERCGTTFYEVRGNGVTIPCFFCGSKNRVAQTEIGNRPRCGRCKTILVLQQ